MLITSPEVYIMSSRLLLTFVAGAALALPAGAQTLYTRSEALQNCQNNIRQQAMDRFGTSDLSFQQLNTNARSGWIGGTLRVGTADGTELQRFSCSANFDTGYVRSARLEGAPTGNAGRDISAAAMDNCRAAIADRIRDDGYYDVRINSLNLNRAGDSASGFARAQGVNHPESFSFSCMLDPGSGIVQTTNLFPR